jgi:hypothetical protein
VQQARKESKVCKVSRVLLVWWALLAPLVRKAQQVTRVQLGRREKTDQLVQQAQPDHKAMQEQRVQLAPQV